MAKNDVLAYMAIKILVPKTNEEVLNAVKYQKLQNGFY